MLLVKYFKLSRRIQNFIVFAGAIFFQLLIRHTNGYLDINQYCKAFDVNFRPIICILKNGTQTAPPNYHQHRPPPPPPPPPPPHPTQYPILHPDTDSDFDFEDDDDECSCEVTCIPRFINQRAIQKSYYHHPIILKRFKRTTSVSYRCRSCGTECPVSTVRPPKCTCVIPATKSECSCSATCANFRFDNPYYFQSANDETDDANCILSVNALEDWRLGEERPPYVCECKRSKEAENTSRPDFICICQRIPINFRTHHTPF